MSVTYPTVFTEAETLERAHQGLNLARYGDGELKLALGGNCISQPGDPRLAEELKAILRSPAKGCLPCIPNVNSRTPKAESWAKWAQQPYLGLYDLARAYGSSFISRPDSAPWIDTPAYWERVKDLWRGKRVALMAGTMRSLRPDMMTEAASVEFIEAPSGQKGDGAYAKVDQLEAAAVKFGGPVLLCVGATATVLANRLAARGVWAQDLGHVGMFARSAGAYRYVLDDLISPEYRKQLIALHADRPWGVDGAKHANAVREFAQELNAETILDYGCGEGKLAEALAPIRVSGFDPGMPGREGMPKPCDLVVCSDVLEHCELEKLNNVFGHIKAITLKGAYVVISTRKAKATLPDGRNAHLVVRDAAWWTKGLVTAGFTVKHAETVEGREELRLWLLR